METVTPASTILTPQEDKGENSKPSTSRMVSYMTITLSTNQDTMARTDALGYQPPVNLPTDQGMDGGDKGGGGERKRRQGKGKGGKAVRCVQWRRNFPSSTLPSCRTSSANASFSALELAGAGHDAETCWQRQHQHTDTRWSSCSVNTEASTLPEPA